MTQAQKSIVDSVEQKILEQLQGLYQMLKANLEEKRSYIQSGDFHYWEMRIHQRLLSLRGGPWWNRILFWAYGFVGDFGENFQKLFFSLFLSFLIAATFVALIEVVWGSYTWQWCLELRPECFWGPIALWGTALKVVFFGVLPSGFQRTVLVQADLTLSSMAVIIFEGLTAVALATLFVMSIRRHFRR